MENKIRSVIAVMTMCILLSGCAIFDSTIPDMSDEEHDVVVEYATKTLLKYDKKHGDKLGRQPEDLVVKPEVIVEEALTEETPEPTPEPEYIEIPENSEAEFPVEDAIEEPVSYSDLNSALGNTDGEISFDYVSYEVVSNYPNSLDAYFIMTATSGNKLLIIKFNAVNNSDHAVILDIPGTYAPSFKLTVNGTTKNALTTILLNDLAYYQNTLEPGASEEVVIVGEFPESDLANVESLSLSVKCNGDETSKNLIIK